MLLKLPNFWSISESQFVVVSIGFTPERPLNDDDSPAPEGWFSITIGNNSIFTPGAIHILISTIIVYKITIYHNHQTHMRRVGLNVNNHISISIQNSTWFHFGSKSRTRRKTPGSTQPLYCTPRTCPLHFLHYPFHSRLFYPDIIIGRHQQN